MIVVKSIELLMYDGDRMEFWTMDGEPAFRMDPTTAVEEITMLSELVRGQKFKNIRGETFCIGMTQEVQDAIGLPMNSFENMEKELFRVRRMRDHYLYMGFWRRIGLAFQLLEGRLKGKWNELRRSSY